MLRNRLGTLCASFVLLTALPFVADAQQTAQAAATIAVRTGEHPDFDRIVFDAPKGTTYKIERQGDEVTVAFSRAARLVLTPFDLARAKRLTVVSGTEANEPLVVRFSVDGKAQTRGFSSGDSIVVDITGPRVTEGAKPEPKAEKKDKPAEAKPTEPKPAAEAAKPAAAAAQTKPSEVAKPQTPPPAVHEPAPVAAAASARASAPAAAPVPDTKTAVPTPQPAPQPTPSPAPTGKDVAPPPQSAPVAPVHNGDAPTRLNPPKEVIPAPLDAQTTARLMALAAEENPRPIVVFDPQVPAGAAIYTRAGFITVVFDRKIAPEAMPDLSKARVKVDVMPLPRNTAFRIAIPSGLEGRVGRKGTAWELYLGKAGSAAGVSTDLVAQPDFALGARLVLSSTNPPDPLYLTDPVVGDSLLILPLRDTAAFTVPRRYADFTILPAVQGLVLRPLHEGVVARIIPDGLEITAEGGLKLSPVQDTGLGKATDTKNLKRLYDLTRWRGRPQDSFIETRQKLLQTMIEVPADQKVLARLDMVRFLFAHCMGTEAKALLDTLPKQLPELESKTDFIALRGAVNILAGNVQAGLVDLSREVLSDQPEATLWKAYGAALAHDWSSAADGFKIAQPYLSIYPEPIRSRMMVMAIESALAAGNKEDATSWLTAFENGSYDPSALAAIHYLRGVVYSLAGRTEKAAAQWRLATKDDDRLYKIRAELALIDLNVATKSMTPRQAADRLEGLRFAWRGDDLEFDILRRLGGFYIDANEYRKGLATLAQALRLYPNGPETQKLRNQMAQMFRDLYTTKQGDALSPLEALSLYSDFRFLIPDGAAGNDIRRTLAERLVAVDLLDPAGTLLNEIITNSSSPSEKAKTATRLAAIRLLDKKPDAAIQALDQSQADAASLGDPDKLQRALMRARALSEKGKYDDALALLPSGAGRDSDLLRADMAMRAKKWDDAAKALLDLVGPASAGKTLSEEQAGWLVNAATALAQTGNTEALDRLAGEYGTAVDGTSKADIFRVLTRPEKMVQMKDLAAAQAKLSEVDMFRGFLNAYRSESGAAKK